MTRRQDKESGKRHNNRNGQEQERSRPVPGRASEQPFCAYMSAAGVTCSETTGLGEVFVIEGKGSPRLTWLACPRHREEVRQMAATFLLQSHESPRPVTFRYGEQIYHIWVQGSRMSD